jgi:carbon-monoxide dehydrogenase large subunit
MTVFATRVGAPVRRREDPPLVQGLGTFVDDVGLPGCLVAAFVRSDLAHARLRALDVEAARRRPGVVAVLTGADVLGRIGTIPCRASVPGMQSPVHHALALDTVCFVGQPIAVVVAGDAAAARDAADAVRVELDPLPAVVDPEGAVAPGAPRIHDDLRDNVAYRLFGPAPDPLGIYTERPPAAPLGLTDDAFARARHVAEFRLVHPRVAPLPLEGRAVAARPERGGAGLTVWVSSQIPHWFRTLLAEALGMAETEVRVIVPDVGGGFGCKIQLYPEELLVPYAARALGRPVRWTESRRENLAVTTHGRGQVQQVRVAFDGDGRLRALRTTIHADLGAYLYFFTPVIPRFSGMIMNGCYAVDALEFEIVGCFTTKMATDAYRGAGRPEAVCIAERAVDVVARALALDPAEVRRRNFIRAFPARTAGGLVYDSGNYPRALETLLALAGYDDLRAEQARQRARGRWLGIGLATYVEVAGYAPSRLRARGLGGWESCEVRVSPTAAVTVLTGLSPHGQGTATAFAQMVSDALGVPLEQVRVLHGDTDAVPYGNGTMGSRGVTVGGGALAMALDAIRAKARRIAALMLEADPDGVVFQDGAFHVADAPERKVGFAEVAFKATDWTFAREVAGVEPGLDAVSRYEPATFAFPFGAHLALVEVHPDTGAIDVLRYVAVDDCGTVVNPLLAEGQVVGGIAQGLGQVLLEEARYDGAGQLVSGTLMDYAIPRADTMPRELTVAHTVTPKPDNPLGAKGVGEAGTIGSIAALMNAVHDALAPLGVQSLDMPYTPERVWRAIRDARSPAGAGRRPGAPQEDSCSAR